jgi:hypothetical protein
MLDLGPIKETHQRAEDSTKGAGEWFADYAQSAHEQRGLLIAEVERLRTALQKLADQRPSTDMDETELDLADFEGAYDIMIGVAKEALGIDEQLTNKDSK